MGRRVQWTLALRPPLGSSAPRKAPPCWVTRLLTQSSGEGSHGRECDVAHVEASTPRISTNVWLFNRRVGVIPHCCQGNAERSTIHARHALAILVCTCAGSRENEFATSICFDEGQTHDPVGWTARFEEIDRATARLRPKRRRLEWAVRFAQEALEELSPGQLLDRRLEVKAFLGYRMGVGGDPEAIRPPSDADMRAIQDECARIIAGLLRRESVPLGEYRVTMSLSFFRGRPHFSRDEGMFTMTELVHARYLLGELIAELWQEGHVIKVCPAPKPRAPAETSCGRWFVGRPNQRFCSTACRNLANNRKTRQRVKQRKRKRA
jgi:hypothetical protein